MSTRPEAGAHGLVLELQAQLDRFADYYNTVRPNRALTRRTRLEAFRARTKAVPRNRPVVVEGHHRVRRDRIVKTGRVTLRYRSKLLHIGIGRAHAGTRVLLLVHDLDARVVDHATGELIRAFTIDPTKDYQPLGLPPGPKPAPRTPN